MKTFFFFFFGDRLKNFCEDLLFFFFWRALALCVLGPWPWPRAFLSLSSERLSLALASDFFCVLGLGLEPCVLDSTSDDYLCMVASNKLQIQWAIIRKNSQEHWILLSKCRFVQAQSTVTGIKSVRMVQ